MAKEKRCKSRSPNHGFRCEKRRDHVLDEFEVTHQQGDITWHDTPDGRVFGEAPKPVFVPEYPEDRFHPMFGDRPPTSTVIRSMPPTKDAIKEAIARRTMHSMCDSSCGPDCPTAEDKQLRRDTEREIAESMARVEAQTELRGWWFDQAEKEIDGTVPKAIEYSSTDLVDIGRVLAFCMGRSVSDEEAAELGIFFYTVGKMSRWAGAIKTGKRVSDDTLYDTGVYVRMVQRVRDAGGWPGVNMEGK